MVKERLQYTKVLNRTTLQVAFLFTDAHVADEGFLELVNSMLTTGMPAALFDDAEKEALIVDIRAEVATPLPLLQGASGMQHTCHLCFFWTRFQSRCMSSSEMG